MSYSQNDEEKVIVEFFKDSPPGRFLDVGAYDGVQMSNTRRLLELGWSGVLVEPGAVNFQKLMLNCQPFIERVTLINGAVAGNKRLANLYIDLTENREWSLTISRDLVDFGSVVKPSPLDVLIPTTTISEIEMCCGPFDFISLDAEWEDMAILKALPKDAMACRLLCVETRNATERLEMKKLLEERRFKTIHETKENIIAAKTAL